ncbi:MAG: hypothetical protein RLZZ618_2492 [Pseudomonadota bacterium]
MKLNIGSGHLQGDIDALHLHDESTVELLRLGRITKTRREGRTKNQRRDDDLRFRPSGRRDGPDAHGSQRHGR